MKQNNPLNTVKEKFKALPPEQKRKVIIFMLVVSFIFVSMLGYFWSKSGKKTEEKKEVSKYEEIRLDTGILEKTQLAESQKKLSELQQEIQAIKEERQKQEEELRKKLEQEEKQKQEEAKKELPPMPPPPPPPPLPAQKESLQPPLPSPTPEVLGGIGVVSQQVSSTKETDLNKEKEVKKKYYLPTSFMEATLLSGLDAPAVSKGQGDPMPALFRIKAPAVLPNEVKANLKGCFVIAEGLGSLADERAHLRLVSLSCIDKKGNAVIDQKVKGFVVDTDGKIGLRGKVVSKMGSVIARSLIAGFFGGLGQTASQFGQNVSVTGAGVVSTPETDKAAQAAIGSGIAQAARDLQKFYLDLAQQTIPVIEVQATRTVTLVISEGVELVIKEYNFN